MTHQRAIVIVLAWLAFSFAAPDFLSRPAGPEPTGKIKGLLLDPNDARIAGAEIRIESPSLGIRRDLKSGEAGEFQSELPPGNYYLNVRANGFCTFEGWEIKVKSGLTEMVNIHLEVLATHRACRCSPRKR